MPIREKFQLEFDEEQDANKKEKVVISSQDDQPIETEGKHKIKIIMNILSDEELNRMADKQE